MGGAHGRARAPLALLLACLFAAGALAQPRGVGKPKTRVIRLDSIAACRPPGVDPSTSVIYGGLTSRCVLQGVVAPDETIQVIFDVPTKPGGPNATAAGSYDLMIQLRTVDGVTKLGLSTPEGDPKDPTPDFLGRTLYTTISSSEEFIALPGDYMKEHGGQYKILVANAMDRSSFFHLRVQTPLATSRLADAEVAALRDLMTTCCGPDVESEFCRFLPTALDPARSPSDDLCRLAPIICDGDGKLTQFVLPGASINCKGLGLPPSFASLNKLETLDLAYNEIGSTASDMAAILSSMPNLQRAFLRGTGLTGALDCALVTNPTLIVLSITGNTGLTGPVPACFLADATLEELYMSDTGLDGPLPDVIPVSSPLRALFIINTGDPGKPALSGPLPLSLGNAANLTYLDLSNNKFEGAIPALPAGLVVLNMSANALTALPASLPPALEMLDVSYNNIAGSAPPVSGSLLILNLEGNALTGELPGFLPVTAAAPPAGGRRHARRRLQQAMVVDASGEDGEDGEDDVPPDPRDDTSPQLRVAYLDSNQFSGPIPAEWTTTPRFLQVLDVGNNSLVGALPTTWDLPRLAILNLAGNQFDGPLPVSLASQHSLIFLDASSNNIGGELGPFAAAMGSGSDRLMHLDLSSNRLEGPVPDSLANSSILNSDSVVLLDGIPAPRVLDLSDNFFSGAVFPLKLMKAIPAEVAACQCRIIVAVNGPDAQLACPTAAEASAVLPFNETDRQVLELYKFNCTAGNGDQVPLLNAMDGKFAGAAARTRKAAPPLPVSVSSPARAGGGGGGGGGNPNAGKIAGAVVGSFAGVALLAAAAALALRRGRRGGGAPAAGLLPPPGGRKGRNGKEPHEAAAPLAPQSSAPLDMGPPERKRSGRSVGGGWGARGAAQDLEAGAFGVMPAPGPATAAAAAVPPSAAAASGAGNAVEMARSGSRGSGGEPAIREITGSGRLRDAIAAAAAEKMARP